VNNNSFSVKV